MGFLKYKFKMVLLTFAAIILLFFGLTYSGVINVNSVGLKLLTSIKKLSGKQVNFNKVVPSTLDNLDHQAWTLLLSQHVKSDGLVDYEGFKQDESQLDNYLTYLSNNAPNPAWQDAEQLAYWINAYNAFTVKLILDHFPIASIKGIGGDVPMINSPWDIKFFKLGEVDFDLNTIEHGILRKQFDEPRIHFAINCASISCPVLRNEAYTTEQLEEQLQDQTLIFLLDASKNNLDASPIELSPIFSWFENDFTKGGNLIQYINQFLATPLLAKSQIKYNDYDWGLNQKE